MIEDMAMKAVKNDGRGKMIFSVSAGYTMARSKGTGFDELH